jgi:AsmA protein
MKRGQMWGIAGAALAALGALMAPWTLGGATLRDEITAYLARKTGLIASAEGRIVLTLAPWPTVKIEDVALRDTGDRFSLRTRTLKGRVRLLPLIAARIEFATLTFANASIDADLDSLAALTRETSTFSSASWTHPGTIDFVASSLRIRRDGRPDARIEGLDAALAWQPGPSSAALTAQGRLNGEGFDVALWIEDPDALGRGRDSAVTLNVGGSLLTASLEGRTQLGPRPQAEGKFAISAPSLREILRRSGWGDDISGLAGKFSATGRLQASPQSLALSEARVSLDSNSFEGGLSLTRGEGRPLLAATLAADRLQLEPFLGGLPRPFLGDFGWSRDPLPKPGLADVDLDLRLSAGSARVRNLTLQDAGFAIKTGDGKLDISLVDSRAYNGRLKGRLVAAAQHEGLSGKLNIAFSHVDAAGLLNGASGQSPLVGDTTGQVALEATGETLADLAQNVQGRIEANILNGDIIGIDVDQALRRSEKRPLSAASEFRRGRTSFAKALFAANVENGKIEILDAQASGFGVATAIAGEFALPERRLALRLASTQADVDGTPKPDGASINVTIAGSFDNPDFDLDFESFIRKSQAAAPLLKGKPSIQPVKP